jgi:thioredoxin-related protein
MKNFVERKNLYYLFLLFVLFFFSFTGLAITFSEEIGNQDHDILNWLSYDQALVKSNVEDIPILIYFYSENCGWCRKLEDETFTNQQVQELMSQYFSIVRINSSSNELIVHNGEKITERQLSEQIYQVRGNPTTWFLSKDRERIAPLSGFVEADVFVHILRYIKDARYKEYTFPEYMEKQNT